MTFVADVLSGSMNLLELACLTLIVTARDLKYGLMVYNSLFRSSSMGHIAWMYEHTDESAVQDDRSDRVPL